MLKTSPSTPLFQNLLNNLAVKLSRSKVSLPFFQSLIYMFKPYDGVKEGNLVSNKDSFVIPRVAHVRKNMRYRFACEAR